MSVMVNYRWPCILFGPRAHSDVVIFEIEDMQVRTERTRMDFARHSTKHVVRWSVGHIMTSLAKQIVMIVDSRIPCIG